MQDRGDRPAADRPALAAINTLLLVGLATLVYFLVPEPGRMRESSWAILFFGGLAVLGLLIMLSIRGLLHAAAGVRARGLIVLLCCVVLFFSWMNVTLSAIPGQFAELHTKIDALYFSVSTLATVGFGDVHAAGQLARIAVIMQMLFNLVFLGTAVTFVSGILRQRVQQSRRQQGLDDVQGRSGPPDGTRPGGAPSAGQGDSGG